MYNPHPRNTVSVPHMLVPRPSSSATLNCISKQGHTSGFDLRKFNDNLEERISRKAMHNQMQKRCRDDPRKQLLQKVRYTQIPTIRNLQQGNQLKNFRSTKFDEFKETLTPTKLSWRKHEPIQVMLEHEHKNTIKQKRLIQSQSHQSALRQLQIKYQDLQQRYKKLLRKACQNVRQFQLEKAELSRIKLLTSQDQITKGRLRKQLVALNESMSKQKLQNPHKTASLSKCKSQQLIESNSLAIDLRPSHQIWKEDKKQQSKMKADVIRFSRNKTTQNWYKNQRVDPCYSEEKKNKQSKYFSSEKTASKSRVELKFENITDYSHQLNAESKISIKHKDKDSLRNSKVRIMAKPVTQTSILLQNRFLKNTPSTLHKKVATSYGYSKYRFKPSYQFQ